MVTCERCLSARHFCRTQGCPCKRCNTVPETPPFRRTRNKPINETRPRRTYVRKGTPGGTPLGTSRLPRPMQVAIEAELSAGGNLSEISRRAGVSRDQVRTIRDRMLRTNQLVHTGEPVGQ